MCTRDLTSFSASEFNHCVQIIDRVEFEVTRTVVHLVHCPSCRRTHSFEIPDADVRFGWLAELYASVKGVSAREAAYHLLEWQKHAA